VDVTFNVRLYVHKDNQLLVIDTPATQSEIHLATGREAQVITPNGQLRTTCNVINEHPTTGENFSVKGLSTYLHDTVWVRSRGISMNNQGDQL